MFWDVPSTAFSPAPCTSPALVCALLHLASPDTIITPTNWLSPRLPRAPGEGAMTGQVGNTIDSWWPVSAGSSVLPFFFNILLFHYLPQLFSHIPHPPHLQPSSSLIFSSFTEKIEVSSWEPFQLYIPDLSAPTSIFSFSLRTQQILITCFWSKVSSFAYALNLILSHFLGNLRLSINLILSQTHSHSHSHSSPSLLYLFASHLTMLKSVFFKKKDSSLTSYTCPSIILSSL